MSNRSRFLKAFDILGIAIALCVILAWMYGLQVRNWRRARDMKRSNPALSLIPRPLADNSVPSDKPAKLTAFGYELSAPWTQVEGHKTGTAVSVYIFSGGRGLSFWNPEAITSTVETVREAVERGNRPFTDFLGAKNDYELVNAELNVTPEQMSPTMSKADSFRRAMLLDMKRVELQREPSALYSFAVNGMRGFQIGAPARDRLVEIRAFDTSSHEFRFLFAVERGSNVKLDQAEINEVLQSVRPAAASEPGAPPSH